MQKFIYIFLFIFSAFSLKAQSSYSEQAEQYAAQGNFEKAIELETENLNLIEKTKGKNTEDYIISLNFLTHYNADLGNYQETVRLGTEALRIIEEVLGRNNPAYANSLSNLAYYNFCLSNSVEAIKLGTEALKILEELGDKNHPVYTASLNNLASYNADLGNYEEAIRLGTEALKIQEEVLGKNTPDYATSLSCLALYYSELDNYQEAVRLGTEALKIQEEMVWKNHPNYVISLINLSGYNYNLGNYQEAICLITKTLKIQEETIGRNNADYATSLVRLSSCYAHLGNYQETVKLGTEALKIQEEVYGKNNSDYVASLNSLAYCNSILGNYQEAVRLGKEALGILEKVYGKFNPDYVVCLRNLASYNSDLGNYQEAVRMESEALEILEKVLGKINSYYATSLNNLAGYNSNLGNYQESFRLGTEALKIQEEVAGKVNSHYALSLNNLANYNSNIGNYQEAIKLATEALKILEDVFGKNDPYYAFSLNSLAYYNSNIGNYVEAIRLGTEALKIREKIFGKVHPDYANSISNLSYYYYFSNDSINLKQCAKVAFKIGERLLFSNFALFTLSERDMYWNSNNYIFNSIPFYNYGYSDVDLTELGFNASLLTKGILLNSEIEFDKFLTETGSPELAEKYNDIRSLRLQLNKLYEMPIAERWCDTDSLERVANNLERELMYESQELGDYTRNLTVTWQDVQKGLKKKDVAIEFVSFSLNRDSTMYMAYVLKPDMKVPEMVILFEEREITSLYSPSKPENIYEKKEAADLIWRKLEPYIEGCDNVYFAPDGVLHQIAIEYFRAPDSGQTMSERYNVYRLSSTRQLALNHDRMDIQKAVLYGGIEFNSDTTMMASQNRRYNLMASRNGGGYYGDNLTEDLKLRAHYDPLPGTKEEVEEIEKLLKKIKKTTKLFSGHEASEASFKSLSGRPPHILHVATHGFYWSEEQADKMAVDNERLLFMSSLDDNGPRYVEDKALTRSGLMMAGVNNTLMKRPIPEGVDDGILTAREIAQMNLRGTDLVVLSACQTGMGEISGDGVFGLQRGFKKAGVNSLLMSLWNVDDDATRMLMIEFYKNLMAGKTKQQALLNAQKTLQAHPKYYLPRYWAGFILLDALN